MFSKEMSEAALVEANMKLVSCRGKKPLGMMIKPATLIASVTKKAKRVVY